MSTIKLVLPAVFAASIAGPADPLQKLAGVGGHLPSRCCDGNEERGASL